MKQLIKYLIVVCLTPVWSIFEHFYSRVNSWRIELKRNNIIKFGKIPLKVRQILREKISSHDRIKLHLGCGTVYKDGWINIDNNSDRNIQKVDLIWDLSYGIPFPDESVDFIFHEHFLEHLPLEDAILFLKECHRVLKHGAVMRIAMPDLKTSVMNYCHNRWYDKNLFDKYNLHFIQSGAQYLNVSFRFWGHCWLYDEFELQRKLIDAGFLPPVFYKNGDSSFPELKKLESRIESDLIAEATNKQG